MRLYFRALPLAIVLLAAAASSAQAWVFDRPSTRYAAPGTELDLLGSGFTSGATVRIGALDCPVLALSDTKITCRVPAGRGLDLDLSVTQNGASQVLMRVFSYAAYIANVSPASAPTSGNSTLTIAGDNFTTSGVTVTVGGANCPVGTVSSLQVTCTLPPGTGTGLDVEVTLATGPKAVARAAFSYDAPTVSAIVPATGPTAGGTSVEIFGSSFGASGATVTIGGVNCPVTAQVQNQLTCTLPAGTGAGLPVAVTVGSRTGTLASAFSYDPPAVSSVSPPVGPTIGGITLTIQGSNFGTTGATVSVGGRNCFVTSQTSTQLTCVEPAGTGAGLTVGVTVGGRTGTKANAFSYEAPLVTFVTPGTGPTTGGTQLLIGGGNFGASGASVTVGGVACPVSSQTDTRITCTAPAGTGTMLDVVVAVGTRTATLRGAFTYDPPTVSSITPNTGPTTGGTALTIQGTNFGTSGATVSVGNAPCTVTAQGNTSITCRTPAGTGTGLDVTVSVDGRSITAPGAFSYGAPAVYAISPPMGPTLGGASMTINGANFGASGATVTIGGASCPVTSQTHDQLTCNLPAGTGAPLPVVVTVGARSGSLNFAFGYEAPVVSGISPADGPAAGGTAVTISGSNFGASGATVTIGGANCPVVSQSHTAIVCSTPAGTGSGLDVKVNVGGRIAPLAAAFSYDPPATTGVTPATGPTTGGMPIHISGSNFGTSGASVTVGGKSCPVSSQTDTEIVCNTPEGIGAPLDVVVTLSARTITLTGAFSYQAPFISSVSPTTGPTSGGTAISIMGANFGASGATVTIGDATCVVTAQTHMSITCNAPAGVGTGLDVKVIVGTRTAAMPGLFSYAAPTIAAVSPSLGSTSGGTVIAISGTNFGPSGAIVTIGGAACTVTSQAHNLIQCSAPAGVGAGYDVVVRVGTRVVSAARAFSYSAPALTSVAASSAPTAGGTDLTLIGSNFGASGATVTVGGADCPVKAQTHSTLACTLPAGAGIDLPVQVAVGGQPSNTETFSYDPPAVASLSPTNGATFGGYELTLTGTNFSDHGAAVLVGGRACALTHQDDTHLRCIVPPGEGRHLAVQVSVAGQDAASVSFDHDPPTVSLLGADAKPTSGGTELVVRGTNFGLTPTVTVGGRACPVTSHTHLEIRCTLPEGEGAVPVVVTVAGQASSAVPLAYDPPAATALLPAHGPTAGGTTIRVEGRNFGENATVHVGGAICTIVTREAAALTCTLAAGEGRVGVVISDAGQDSPPVSFAYDAPLLVTVTPDHGPTAGGTELQLGGANFGLAAKVTVDGSNCPVVRQTHQQLTCALPPGVGAGRAVVVTVAGQVSAPARFSYDVPVVTGVTPTALATAGGEMLAIDGANFGESGAASVTIDGKPCPVMFHSERVIQCVTPAGQGASRSLVVTVEGQSSAPFAVPTAPPRLLSVDPAVGPLAGGVTVTLIGADLGTEHGTVTIGGIDCPVLTQTHDQVTCALPAGSGRRLPVVVTVDGVASNTLEFSYESRPPVATPDTVETDEDTPVEITLHAQDPDGDAVTFTLEAQPPAAEGSVALEGSTATFTPAPDFHGTTSFSFRASDDALDSNTVQVTVNVRPVNDAPVLVPATLATDEDTALTFAPEVRDADGDALTLRLLTPPAAEAGTVAVEGPSVVFTPAAEFHGEATFALDAFDGTLASAPATFTVAVASEPDAPVVEPVDATTAEDTELRVELTARDGDGDALTFLVAEPPGAEAGTVRIEGNTAVVTPARDYDGLLTATIAATDGTLTSAPARLQVEVTPVNDPPVAEGQALTTASATPLQIVLSAVDADDDLLTYTLATPPPAAEATVSLEGHTARFTPAPAFEGTTSFGFRVSDGKEEATATISVTVAAAPPIAFVAPTPTAPVAATVGAKTTFTVLARGGNAALVYAANGLPAGARVEATSGAFAWTPTTSDAGAHEITFTATDGVHTGNAVVTVDVAPGAGCAGCSGAPGGAWLLFGFLALGRRRRGRETTVATTPRG